MRVPVVMPHSNCFLSIIYSPSLACRLAKLASVAIVASLSIQQLPMLVHGLQELGAVKWLTQTHLECPSGFIRHCGYD